jgi:hypothetical protein
MASFVTKKSRTQIIFIFENLEESSENFSVAN